MPQQVCLGKNVFHGLRSATMYSFLSVILIPRDPKQPVAIAVKVVEREVGLPNEKQLKRHPKARGKKPTWR